MAEEKIVQATVQPEEFVVHARIAGWIPLGVLDNHNYEKLINKPKINGVELIGDKSLKDLGISDLADDKINEHNTSLDAHKNLYITKEETSSVLEKKKTLEQNKLLESTNALPQIRDWTTSEISKEDSAIRELVNKTRSDVVGKQDDSVDQISIYGVRNRADKYNNDITGSTNDTENDLTLNGLSKKDQCNFNKLDEKIDKTKADLTGIPDDPSSKLTLNGLNNRISDTNTRITDEKNSIIGTTKDDASKFTMYGFSKRITDAQNAVTGESTDSEDDLTLWGLKKRIITHGTDANKSIQDLTKMIDNNTKSISNVMGTDPDSTDDTSVYGLRNNLAKLKEETIGNESDSENELTLHGLEKRIMAEKADVVGKGNDEKPTLTLHALDNRLTELTTLVTGDKNIDPKDVSSNYQLTNDVKSLSKKLNDAVGTEDDAFNTLSLNGLKKRVDKNELTISDHALAIGSNTSEITTIIGKKDDSTDTLSLNGLSNRIKNDETSITNLQSKQDEQNNTIGNIIGGNNGKDTSLADLKQRIDTNDAADEKVVNRVDKIEDAISKMENVDSINFEGTTFISGSIDTGTTDANQMLNNGHYRFLSNGPKDLKTGAVYAQGDGSSNVSQIAQDYETGELYTRGMSKGTWSEWTKVPTASLVASLQSVANSNASDISSLKELSKYKTSSLTLAASKWSGDTVPYTYDLGSEYTDKFAIVSFDSSKGTAEQMKSLQKASTSGSSGSKLYAFGKKPTIDIPVTIAWIGGGANG